MPYSPRQSWNANENRFSVNERGGGAWPFTGATGASNLILPKTLCEEDDDGQPANTSYLLRRSNQEYGDVKWMKFEGNMGGVPPPTAAAVVPRAGTPNLPSERTSGPPNPLPSQPPYHWLPPHDNIPTNPVNDPVHAHVGFALEMNLAHINNHNNPPPIYPHPHPSHNHLLSNLVSGPPSPRGIEDTHLNFDMSEIQYFASPPSVDSINSGTSGGSNHDHHEVPSGSVLRADIHEFSDTEMSMFDFEENPSLFVI